MKKVFSKEIKFLLIIAVIFSLSILCFRHSAVATEAEDLSQEGIGYYKKGAYNTAVITLKEAIELDPNIIEVHYYLGLAYEAKEMYEDAIKAYKKVREVATTRNETTDGASRHLLGIYVKRGMWDEMLNLLKEAQQRYKDKLAPEEILRMHYGFGKTYMMKEMYAESINEFEKVIQMQPDFDPDIYYYLGCNYNYLADREKAIENLKKYLELVPDGKFADEAENLIEQLTEAEEKE